MNYLIEDVIEDLKNLGIDADVTGNRLTTIIAFDNTREMNLYKVAGSIKECKSSLHMSVYLVLKDDPQYGKWGWFKV